MSQQACYCGGPQDFIRCCAPLLQGSTTAITAEQLMRSRFSAFCTANIDYLIATHHPSKHQQDDRLSLADTIEQCQWRQLVILNSKQGQANHQTGQVEFVATYTSQDKPFQLRENSRFIKEQGRWFYLDGVINDAATGKYSPNRNDPCWCGSHKKFKNCHR